MTAHDFLHANRLLRGCPADVLARIEPLIQTLDLPGAHVLYRQGEPADSMYLVFAGAVCLTRKTAVGADELLARVGPEDFFGDMALLDAEPHAVQAATAEPSVLGRIDRPGIEEILRLAPHVVPLNFVRAVHRRVKNSHQHFTEEILRGERLYHVGTMTGSIIHDFKTPLTTILCACDLLETRAHDETHRKMAEVIKRSVERMIAMTQELLDYTLGGSAALHFELVSIRSIMAALNEQCLDDLASKGFTVERRIEFDGDVEIDTMRFERMLLNLFKNAHEAMGRSGVLRLTVTESGGWVTIEVADTGRGMEPEVAARIFEPFFTHGKPQGTGLGMSMVMSVVDAHRGSIRVESELGRGTKFEIKIPLRQPPRHERPRCR